MSPVYFVPQFVAQKVVPVFPGGALGVWYADQVVTTNGNLVVPNSASVVPVSRNLLRAPRRYFNDSATTFWRPQLGGGSVVDSNVVGQDGLTQASTLTGIGAWVLIFRANGGQQLIWPAGTYTVAISAQRATGSNQSFALIDQLGNFTSSTFTATSAWQRMSCTFTIGSPTNMQIALSNVASANATIAICDFEMFLSPGATPGSFTGGFPGSIANPGDFGPETLGGHWYLGGTPTIAAPTTGGGYIDMTAGSGAYGLIQLPAPQSITTFTFSALINRTATGNTLQRALVQEAGNASNFELFEAFTLPTKDTPGINFSGSSNSPQITGLWNQLTAGPHVVTWRYDGTLMEVFLDDVIVSYFSNPGLSAVTVANLIIGLNEGGFEINGGDKIGAMALWSSALTNAQIYNICDFWASHFSSFYSVTLWPYYYFADGDSITAGAGTTAYPYVYGPLASHPVFGYNFAIAGVGIATLVSTNVPILLTLLPPASRQSGRNFILSLAIGSNDMATTTGAVEASTVGTQYVDPLQAVGWKIYTGTIIDRADTPGGNAPWATNASAYNTIIKGAWGHGSGFIDFAANVNLGPPMGHGGGGPATNLTYFQADQVHPNQTGENLMETILKPVIDAAGP